MPAPLANVITLGALDLPRLRAFYGALEWPQILDEEDFAAFELRGAVLALFPRDKLAADGRVEPSPDVRCRFTIGLMTDSRDEVDAVVDQMRAAGAVVTKAAEDAEFFEGRSAYVADPEGNLWEVAWAPDDNPVVAAARRASGGGVET
jgi:catechol 2,3-dioxygenase-like lactoylglutathione lyase family enzyme